MTAGAGAQSPLTLRGRTWRLGDDVNTDVIYPGRYLSLFDPKEAAKHAFEGLDPAFAAKIRPGDILVAGKFFGCGSSREMAVVCVKAAGIQAIVAKSFARIYFRNAVNQGLWVIQCEQADQIMEGDSLALRPLDGTITDETTGRSFAARTIPPFLSEIIQAGGLVPHLRAKLGTSRPPVEQSAASEVG